MSTITPLPSQADPRQRVAAEVRALMGRYDVTQSRLAEALGMGQSQLSKRLKGLIPFDIDEVGRIADYFDVTVGSLFGETSIAPGPDGGGTRRGVLGLDSGDPTTTQEYVPHLVAA